MTARHTVVAWDSETGLIRPALLAPPLVVVTWQTPGQPAQIASHMDAEPIVRGWLTSSAQLTGHNVAFDFAVACQEYPELRELVFAAYDADRVTDTMIRQQLLDIAGGVYRGRMGEKGRFISYKYALEDVAKRKAGMVLVKDGWRLSYSNFRGVPLEQWPTRAREVQAAARPKVVELERRLSDATVAKDKTLVKDLVKERDGLVEMIDSDPARASEYPLDDARATLAVYLAQEAHAGYLADQYRQARAAFALYLSSAWGMRTTGEGVERLRIATQAAYDALEDELIQLGLIRDDKARTRDTKAAKARMIRVCLEERLPLRRTESHDDKKKGGARKTLEESTCKGADGARLPAGDASCIEHVSLDDDACKATEDDVLHAYAEISTLKKVLSNDIEALSKGVLYPVHTRYGLAETGRTTSSKPNIQNVRRLPGIRECFVPRTGHVFFQADYPALEMYTLAQCCVTWLGESKLAEALNSGMDPHLEMARQMLGISYAEAKARRAAKNKEVDDVRQLAKVANFGFPGGMGPPTLLGSAKKQLKPEVVERLGLDLARMKLLKEQWYAAWPEMPRYFARVNVLCDTDDGKAYVETLFTKRFRGGASYCATCNNGFQGLGSDCAKEAAWRICREQYVRRESPLFDSRTVAFVHDEFIGEATLERAAGAAMRLADVMVEGANIYLPDVPISRAKLEPLLMTVWSKDAKPVVDAEGRLMPWTP